MIRKGYKFKTNSDVEVIIPLFIFFGTSGFQLLDGMFSFALLDTKQNELYICRDRYGIKPLYYLHKDDGTLYFASEIKSIRKID